MEFFLNSAPQTLDNLESQDESAFQESKNGNISRRSKESTSYQQKEYQDSGSPYHWTLTQQKRYINFLAERRDTFLLSSKGKRVRGIHSKMSKFIRSRNSTQCRSHHQKMLFKYGSVDEILEGMKKYIYKKNLDKLERKGLPLNGKEIQFTMKVEETINFVEKDVFEDLESFEIKPLENEFVGEEQLNNILDFNPIQLFDFGAYQHEDELDLFHA